MQGGTVEGKTRRYRAACAVHEIFVAVEDEREIKRLGSDVGDAAANRAAHITK